MAAAASDGPPTNLQSHTAVIQDTFLWERRASGVRPMVNGLESLLCALLWTAKTLGRQLMAIGCSCQLPSRPRCSTPVALVTIWRETSIGSAKQVEIGVGFSPSAKVGEKWELGFFCTVITAGAVY